MTNLKYLFTVFRNCFQIGLILIIRRKVATSVVDRYIVWISIFGVLVEVEIPVCRPLMLVNVPMTKTFRVIAIYRAYLLP